MCSAPAAANARLNDLLAKDPSTFGAVSLANPRGLPPPPAPAPVNSNDLVAGVDQVLRNSALTGTPLRAGDLPLYGEDGQTTGLVALAQAGRLSLQLMQLYLTGLSFVPGPIGLAARGVGILAQLAQGDYEGAAWAVVGSIARINPCGRNAVIQTVVRGAGISMAARGAVDAYHNAQQGNFGSAALNVLQAGMDLFGALRACFARGTLLLTPAGYRPIEELRPGDEVLARSEFDPQGPVQPRQVEEVFVRTGRIMHLHAGGQVVRTTPEHPFYVQGKGWVAAGQLQAGDLLSSHDSRWVAVEELLDTGEYEAVYNCRVADFHTYFVGCHEWGGWSLWAHNSYEGTTAQERRAWEGRMVAALQHHGVSEGNARAIARAYRNSTTQNGSEVVRQLESRIPSGAPPTAALPVQPDMRRIVNGGWEPTVHIDPQTGRPTIEVGPIQAGRQAPHIEAERNSMRASGDYLFIVADQPLSRALGDQPLRQVRYPANIGERIGRKEADLVGILHSRDARVVEIASPSQLPGGSERTAFEMKNIQLNATLRNRYQGQGVRVGIDFIEPHYP